MANLVKAVQVPAASEWVNYTVRFYATHVEYMRSADPLASEEKLLYPDTMRILSGVKASTIEVANPPEHGFPPGMQAYILDIQRVPTRDLLSVLKQLQPINQKYHRVHLCLNRGDEALELIHYLSNPNNVLQLTISEFVSQNLWSELKCTRFTIRRMDGIEIKEIEQWIRLLVKEWQSKEREIDAIKFETGVHRDPERFIRSDGECLSVVRTNEGIVLSCSGSD